MSQDLTGTEINFPLDPNINDKNKRQTQQMLRFFAGTALTLLCSRLIRRTMNNLKYTPKIFHTNNNPPNQIYQGEATKALALSSGLSVGLFSMFIFGGCWFYDVSTLKEFSNGISGFFIRHGMGQQIREIEDSQDSFGSISDILNDEDN
ncbi:Altered inheritance of mitochondria protein 11 [Maudiozyma exigua]|uniref:Altered inheritance of mitochondria protein 11 n=1 Tax=Maudiozyma exigua TaxID=34358 RepID=A0A9P6WA26_MAUEX|nr:Altered inheritance of mitochondria protein 11 [Kazachstania exigua]